MGLGNRGRSLLLCIAACWCGCGNPAPSEGRKIPAPDYVPPPPAVKGPRIDVMPVQADPPFVGEEGTDAHGYPLRQPDMATILAMLRLQRFDLLEKWLDFYQAQFAEDFHKERWPDIAVSSFFIADPELGAHLDAWVKHSPEHFAPWVARGNFYFKLGQHFRGGAYARYTSLAQFRSMREFNDAATKDFDRAIALEPGLLAAYRRAMQVAPPDSHDERRYHDAAIERCELCFSVRSLYVQGLAPRWGGSHAAMERYVKGVAPLFGRNPKLALLAGYVPWDRCRNAREAKRPDEAKRACAAALAVGEHPDFLGEAVRLVDPATAPKEALALLDPLLRLRPQDRSALGKRFVARGTLKDYVGAAQDIRIARHLRPADEWVAGRAQWIVDALRYEGQELAKAGKHVEAIPHFTTALQLAPDDNDLRQRAAWSQTQLGFEGLDARLAEAPDDFELRLLKDHGLAMQRRFDEVAKMWDAFIERNPLDPRAYTERAGAKWHLGKQPAAIADMDRACQLGLQKACVDAKRMRSRIPGAAK